MAKKTSSTLLVPNVKWGRTQHMYHFLIKFATYIHLLTKYASKHDFRESWNFRTFEALEYGFLKTKRLKRTEKNPTTSFEIQTDMILN